MERRKQNSGKPFGKMQGSTLLEVLVSILIFACGILAIVGQQAQSAKNSGDVQYRAEAIHLVNAYVGKIKTMAPSTSGSGGDMDSVESDFHGEWNSGGPEFELFKKGLARLPGGVVNKVDFNSPSCTNLPAGTRCVDIEVSWQPPGEKDVNGSQVIHRHTQTSVIGNNVE